MNPTDKMEMQVEELDDGGATVALPEVGLINPDSILIAVVLPAPFAPIRVTTLFLGTSILIFFRTFTLP